MTDKAEIFYKDIGDYLSREEKLRMASEGRSILNPALNMARLNPNEHGDWINKRNSMFDDFIPIEPEKKFDAKAQSFFSTFAIGAATNRAPWVYNFSKDIITKNMKRMIAFYNEQRIGFQKTKQELEVIDYIDANPSKTSWTRALRNDVEKNTCHKFNETEMRTGLYRPFSKQFLYYDRPFIESPGLWEQLFPTPDSQNVVICISCVGTTKDLSVLICESIPDLHFIGDTQCFPLYWYEKKEKVQGSLFGRPEGGKYADEYIRRDGISDFILDQAKSRYGFKVTKLELQKRRFLELRGRF